MSKLSGCRGLGLKRGSCKAQAGCRGCTYKPLSVGVGETLTCSETPPPTQVHWELVPDSRIKKRSAESSSLYMDQLPHWGVSQGGQRVRAPAAPASPRPPALTYGGAAAPWEAQARRHPSARAHTHPQAGPRTPAPLPPVWAARPRSCLGRPRTGAPTLPLLSPGAASAIAKAPPFRYPRHCPRHPRRPPVPASPPPPGAAARPTLHACQLRLRLTLLFLASTSRKMTLRQQRWSKATPRGLRC